MLNEHLQNLPEKITDCCNQLILNTKMDYSFWGEFSLFINFIKGNDIVPTCGVTLKNSEPVFYFNENFLKKQSQKQYNFIHIHELMHLLNDHVHRTMFGVFQHKMANIVQDMIINTTIKSSVSSDFISEPEGAYFIPAEYKGSEIFEELYDWMQNQKNKYDNDKKSVSEEMQKILSNLEEYEFDKHFQISPEEKELLKQTIDSILENMKSRGLVTSNIEQMLQKLRPSKKNHLRVILKQIAALKGFFKTKSYRRLNRRGLTALKGKIKNGAKLNVILDTSGSMSGDFEKALSYIFFDNIEFNFIMNDTEVKSVEKYKSRKDIQTTKIAGLGGTILQPAIDLVKKEFSQFNTVVLTDGYTDTLDFTGCGQKNLVITTGQKPSVKNAKIIVIEK